MQNIFRKNQDKLLLTSSSILSITLIFLIVSTQIVASEKIYTFGIVPQQSATRLAQKWVPIMKLLKEKNGDTFRFSTARDIPTFEKRLAAGEYDFAYMNPYHYTVYHRKPGYKAFARQANKKIKGILVTRKDSTLQSIEDINNEPIAFPAPAAFAATLLSRSHLDSHSIKYIPKYVSSHDSVYRAVAGGFARVGGGIYRTFNAIDEEIKSRLKVIWESKGHTPHAFAAHPRIDNTVVQKVKNSLIELSASEVGRSALKNINMKIIESAQNSDWDDIKALNIKLLPSNN